MDGQRDIICDESTELTPELAQAVVQVMRSAGIAAQLADSYCGHQGIVINVRPVTFGPPERQDVPPRPGGEQRYSDIGHPSSPTLSRP